MPPKTIDGRYRIQKKLGFTAMGEVYKVKDLTDGSTLALKISPEKSVQEDIVRFKREFYTLSRLHHTNIVGVKDFGILGKKDSPGYPSAPLRCYFSMEYVEGEDILAFFNRKRPFTEKTYGLLCLALSQLCHALFYIHSKGLVHCDLKPANLLIAKGTSNPDSQSRSDAESLSLRLLDFGLADDIVASSEHSAAGTLGYMAPEVLRSGRADIRSDLYSLGVILWETLAARRAFPGDEPISIIRDNLSKRLASPTSYDSTIPEPLAHLVMRLIGKEPRDRYSSALDVLGALSSIAPQIALGRLPTEALCLLSSSLVGRDEVLSSFGSLLGKAKEGAGQVMVLRGERGIGKSRLLREFKFQAQLDGSTVLFGSCCQSEKTPFSPWRQILSQLRQRDGKEVPGFAQEASAPEGELELKKLQIFERIASSIVESSREDTGPLVILIDDLDLADSNGLDFFAYLCKSLQSSRVLLATFCEKSTTLAECLGQLQGLPSVNIMELKELRPEDTHLMVSNMLGSQHSHDPLAKWVHEQAGGNPLLTEETMCSLVKHKVLTRDGPRWAFRAKDVERTKLSKDAESLLQHWLSGLDKREAELLSCASVLGDGFDLRILEELSILEGHPFFRAFDSLEAQNLVRREQGTNFAFTHKWAQRLLYHRIPALERRNTHRKALRVIERLSPERSFDLAHHSLQGELKGKAYKYSLLVGEKAKESFANREALQYFRHALKLSYELHKPEERLRILEHVGDLCNVLGEYDEGLEAYKSAQAMLSSSKEAPPVPLPVLLRKRATIHHKRGDYGRALESLEEARKTAGKDSEEMSRILNEIGWVHQMKGEYQGASSSYNRALEIAKNREDLAMLSRTYYNLGVLFWRQKDLGLAVRHCENALSIDRRTKDPYALASCHGLLGAIYFASGELEKAIKSYEEYLRLTRETSEVYGQVNSLTSLGTLSTRRGNLDGALDYLSQAVPLAEKIGDATMRGQVHSDLGFVYYQKGKWEGALDHYQRGLSALQESGDKGWLATCYENLGMLHLGKGDLDTAHAELKRAIEIREERKERRGLAASYFDMGRLLVEKSQYEKALHYLRRSAAIYEDEGAEYDLARVLNSLAEAHLSLGDKDKALKCSSESLELAKEAGNPFALGNAHRTLAKAHFEHGNYEEMGENLSQSTGIFRRLGAKFELGKSLLEAGSLALRIVEGGGALDWLSSARSSLREAERIFRELGARVYLERTRPWLDSCVDRVLSSDFEFSRRGDYLKILYQISELVNSISTQDELLNQVLDLTIRLVGGERGLLLLIDNKTNDFFLAAGHNVDKATVSDATHISRTIVDRVVESGKPVISNDALRDPGFRESNSVLLNKIRSLLCVPLMAKGETIGTIYVDSRLQASIFSQKDEGFLVAVANLIGATIDQSKLSAEIQSENLSLKRKLHQRRGLGDMIGRSEEMQRVYQEAEKVAAPGCTVLLQGETGTGKELLARAIHGLSERSTKKFLTIDCSALIETLLESELFGHKKGSFTGAIEDKAGLFEEAHQGTIFLDEIGDASLSVQAKLLRAIERGEIRRVGETKWRKVDVRVICATNKDLEEEVKRRGFREDLFYRLNTFTITVPPLRERAGDVYLLANYFLKRYRTHFKKNIVGFAPEALDYLMAHRWPGNVRQLEKTIERAVVMCEGKRISLRDISPESMEAISQPLPLRETKAQAEARRVEQALLAAQGNVTRAAEALGVSRRQVYRLVAKHGIDRGSLAKLPSP